MEDVPAPGKRCREAGAGEVPAQASGLLVWPLGGHFLPQTASPPPPKTAEHESDPQHGPLLPPVGSLADSSLGALTSTLSNRTPRTPE